jgi:transcriptional antiterminator Rof (Rho-off)
LGPHDSGRIDDLRKGVPFERCRSWEVEEVSFASDAPFHESAATLIGASLPFFSPERCGKVVPHPNEVRIRNAIEAMLRREPSPDPTLWDPKMVWHVFRHGLLPGELNGGAEVQAWASELDKRSGGTIKEELLDVAANDQTGYMRTKYRAERGGRSIEEQSVNVFRFHSGRVVECWVFWQNPEGFDDFWS